MVGTILEYLPVVVGIGVGFGYPIAFVVKAIRSAPVAGRDGTGRVALVDAFLVAALALLFAWLWVPWHVVPPVVWAGLVGLVVYGAVRAVPALRAGPWAAGPHPGRKLASTAVGAAAVVALFAAVIV
jgi:hypothetical protein